MFFLSLIQNIILFGQKQEHIGLNLVTYETLNVTNSLFRS